MSVQVGNGQSAVNESASPAIAIPSATSATVSPAPAVGELETYLGTVRAGSKMFAPFVGGVTDSVHGERGRDRDARSPP